MTAPPGPSAQRDPAWPRLLLWTLIGAYLIAIGTWAFSAGVEMREQTWDYSRSIHFQTDISNAMRWGNMVLRAGQKLAHIKQEQRPLTLVEMIRGEGEVYQNLVANNPEEGDYELDYPPLRLFVNALWTRHVQTLIPGLETWPGAWTANYNAAGNARALATEDLGKPLLLMNTYAAAAAAVISFLLVCIWVNRGGRPTLPGHKLRLIPWRPVRIASAHGLILFPLAATAFFYAIVISESPCPPSPPTVTLADRPIVMTSAKDISAVISATVDGQGGDTQWQVDWGTTPAYSHHSASQSAGAEEAGAVLVNLPPHTTIHYRIVATSDRGITRTNDETFNTADTLAPMPSRQTYGAVWLAWPQWAGIAILFASMSGALSVMPPVHRAWAAGLVAALFLWFDPSVLADGHIYPQWDVWLLPVFLGAALLATLDWWATAGIVLGAGMMFKGQILVAGPILAIWPLMAGRWGALTRLVIGFLTAVGIIVSPWVVLSNRPADWSVGPLRWIGGVLCAAAIAAALSFYRRPVQRQALQLWRELSGKASAPVPVPAPLLQTLFFGVISLAGIIVMTLLVLRRWPPDLLAPSRMIGLALLLAIILPPWLLPRRTMALWLAAVLGSSIWISAYLYHGDWSWKIIGFDYGTRKHTMMALGANTIGSLPRILQTRFGWDVHDQAMTLYPPDIAGPLHGLGLNGLPIQLDIRQLLIAVFAILMVLAGIGAALQSRRNHPRFLAAIASVWVLMPNVLCQMAGRYQMWGAAMTCLLIAVSPGLTLLHVVLSLLATGMITGQLLQRDAGRSPQLFDLVSRFSPDNGLIALTIGLIVLYLALAPGRRPTRQELYLP
jgi:hypothetical protein